MSYQIESAASFDRAVKRTAKKYRLIKRDLRGLVDILADNPFAGDAIPGFAHEVWKIRLASKAGRRFTQILSVFINGYFSGQMKSGTQIYAEDTDCADFIRVSQCSSVAIFRAVRRMRIATAS